MITTGDRVPFMFAYGRASTDKQQITLGAQEHTCKVYFDFRNADGETLKWGGWHPDAAITAKIPFSERPMGERILNLAKPGDLIVVSNFDRIFRSVIDCSRTMDMLKERQIALVLRDLELRTDTNNGRMIMQIMATIKEYELREISRRTKETKKYQIKTHSPHGNYSPMGWKKGWKGRTRIFVPNMEERKWGYRIKQMIDDEGMTMRAVAKALMKDRSYKRHIKNEYTMFNEVRHYYIATLCGFPRVPRMCLPTAREIRTYLAEHGGRPPLLQHDEAKTGPLRNVPPRKAPQPVDFSPVDP